MDRYIVREPKLAHLPTPNVQGALSFEMYGNNIEQQHNKLIEHPGHYFSGIENAAFLHSDINQSYLQSHLTPLPLQRPQAEPQQVRTYSGNNVSFIHGGNVQELPQRINVFGPYYDHNFIGPERNTVRSFSPRIVATGANLASRQTNEGFMPTNVNSKPNTPFPVVTTPKQMEKVKKVSDNHPEHLKPRTSTATSHKNDEANQDKTMTRADKLKALYKSGPRTFSGPVEKVLKWHKSLQGIGVSVFYEVVAKCLNVRAGEGCCKQLLIRDEGGPAIQLMYYEIDFLLPELHPPCMIRVVGKVMPGSSRLQAYSVRPATGDDVAALARRAAVADHHVAKLRKEYGDPANK